MKRWVLGGVLLAASLVTMPVGSSVRDALGFMFRMLAAIDAPDIECPDEVLEAARSWEMGVVCAKYDGEFQAFKSTWDQVHATQRSLSVARGVPRTTWEMNDGTYERIYSLGATVVGVRFRDGEILLFYK
jgi:hypothetical protein